MVRQYVGAAKFISNLLKGGKQKTTGTEVVKSVKANPQTKESAHKIKLAKIPGEVQRKFMPSQRDMQKTSVAFKQINQKLRGEPITESGVSKGKDMKVKKELKRGGRVGLKRGTGLTKKSNVQKIKETFGPKKGRLGMQSVIYGLDKNPNITKADPKAKFIAAANKKKKRTMAMGGGFMGRRMGYSSGTDPKMIEGVSEAKEKRILKSKRKP